MRVNLVLVNRFNCRAPALAACCFAVLATAGCATRNQLTLEAPMSTAPAAVALDAQKDAATANAGAQTKTVTKLQKFLWFVSPYRPDIQQGNFVSQEMLAQIKTGMTREQIKFILGTPLLTDIFHADRWDYPFYLARGNGELTTSRVTVYFKDGKVDHFDGGNLPTEKEYIAKIAGPARVAAPKKDEAAPAPAKLNE